MRFFGFALRMTLGRDPRLRGDDVCNKFTSQHNNFMLSTYANPEQETACFIIKGVGVCPSL